MSSRRALLIVTGVIVMTSLYVNLIMNHFEASVYREPLSTFPKTIAGWSGTDQSFPTPILENLGIDEYLMRRFSDGKDSIWLYIGYYKSQREGAVPHSPRNCYPGSGWTPMKHDVVSISVGSPGRKEIRPNRYVFAKGNQRECVIYWYQSRGRAVANEYWDRLYLVLDSVFRGRSDGALVRFSTGATAETQDEAIKRIEAFISSAYPFIPRVIPD